MAIRAFVCDVDGVLLNSRQSVYQSYRAAFAQQGFELTEQIFQQMWGKPWNPGLFPSSLDLDRVRSLKNQLMDAVKIPISQTAVDLLGAFAASGAKIVIC